MRKLVKPLAAAALVALVFTVPAVVVRGAEQASDETAEEEQLEEFEPTEEVDADEAISFPVDI